MAISISQQFHTIEDFEAFVAQPENVERRFELIHGEIVEKVPTEEHSLLIGNLYLLLRLYNDAHDLGRVAFEVRRKIPGDDHNARLPDLEFTSKARLLPVVREGAVPQMPDLAVEVKSPDDTYIELRETGMAAVPRTATDRNPHHRVDQNPKHRRLSGRRRCPPRLSRRRARCVQRLRFC